MDDSGRKPVATEEKQVLWEFSESEGWSFHEKEVTGEPVAYRKSAEKPAASKIKGILKLKERNGHIIFTYPRQSCLKWTNLFDCENDLRTRTRGPNGGPQRERGYLGMPRNTTLQGAVDLGQDTEQNTI